MRKKLLFFLGLLALLPVLFWLAWRSRSEFTLPVVWASRVDSSFTSPYNISKSPSYNSTQHPRLVIAPDTYLHVTWMEGTLDEANGPAYLRGREGEWPQWEWAGPHNNPGYTNPAIALGGDGTVHLAWAGGGGPPYDIYYAYKPVAGSWSTPVNISNMAGNTVYPSIAVDSQGKVWVAWQTSVSDTNTEVYVAYKPSGGNWSSPVKISISSKEDQNPILVIGPGDIPHVVWRNNDTNWEILYSKFEGGTWSAPVNVSATSTHSHFPRIAADSAGNLFVVWEDEIDGPDIFPPLEWQPVASVQARFFFDQGALSGHFLRRLQPVCGLARLPRRLGNILLAFYRLWEHLARR